MLPPPLAVTFVEQFIALESPKGNLVRGQKTSADVRRSFFPFAFNAVSENPSPIGSNDLGFFQVTISSELLGPDDWRSVKLREKENLLRDCLVMILNRVPLRHACTEHDESRYRAYQ